MAKGKSMRSPVWGPTRRVVLCAVLLLTALAAPTAAQARSTAATGTTTIVLSAAAASATVTLPRDVSYSGSCFPEKAVTISGSAESVLVTLVPAAGDEPAYFGRFPKRQGGSHFSNMCGPRTVLPAGTYQLVALRSPGSATVVLQFPGLTGRSSLRPTGSTSARLADLPPVATYATSEGVVSSFGATRRLTSKGMIAVVGWVQHPDVNAVGTIGDCEMRRDASADSARDAVDFAPGCPNGSSSSSMPGPSGPGTDFFASGYANITADTWGAGYYYVSSTKAASAGALAAWVPYGD